MCSALFKFFPLSETGRGKLLDSRHSASSLKVPGLGNIQSSGPKGSLWEDHQESFLEEVTKLGDSLRDGKEEAWGPLSTCQESAFQSARPVWLAWGVRPGGGRSRGSRALVGDGVHGGGRQLWFHLVLLSFLNVPCPQRESG